MNIKKITIVLCPMLLLWCTFGMVSVAEARTIQEVYSAAQFAQKKGEINAAIFEYSTVVKMLKDIGKTSNAQEMQGNIGRLYFSQKKYVEAADAFKKALDLHKNPTAAERINLTRNLANSLRELGRYATMTRVLDNLLSDNKLDWKDQVLRADTIALLADGYKHNEIYSKAISNYHKSLDIYLKEKEKSLSKQSLILTNLGLSQSSQGDFKEAIKNLTAALESIQNENNALSLAQIYSNLGIVYWDKGDYAKALDLITKAKSIETKNELSEQLGRDFNNEGLIYKSVGNYTKAITSIDQAITIANKLGNKKSQAIALSNRGLIRRILGQYDSAVKDYEATLAIYQEVKFDEGLANTYLGLGKLYEIRDRDYAKALEYYKKSLAIFDQLGNLAYKAEAYNQIGRVLKKSINPTRTTRDFLFDADPPEFATNPATAAVESIIAYEEALRLGRLTEKREVIWSALHGLGYSFYEQKKYDQAFDKYKKAIEIVTSIQGIDLDSELMSDYLKDKEDLFDEAIEVCVKLFEQMKKEEFLKYQLQWQETYKNEIMKNAVQMANIKFEDPAKEDLAKSMKEILAKKSKLEKTTSQQQTVFNRLQADVSVDKENSERKVESKNELTVAQAEVKKLDGTFQEYLKRWKETYPADAQIFDTMAKFDMSEIQKNLSEKQAIIQYFPLLDFLNIICITREEIVTVKVPIKNEELTKLIRDELIYKSTEGLREIDSKELEEKNFQESNKTLSFLYDKLLRPIEANISNKSRLIVVTNKYISYVPFPALVRGTREDKTPDFLVYDKAVSSVRLSFIDALKKGKSSSQKNGIELLAIGNPKHVALKIGLPNLPGTEKEVNNVVQLIKEQQMGQSEEMIGESATETAWKSAVKNKKYNVMYFATHGVPYSETLYSMNILEKELDKFIKQKNEFIKQKNENHSILEENQKLKIEKLNIEKKIENLTIYKDFVKKTFISKSPLNGYLYMSLRDDDKSGEDGVLLLKEIMELPESIFEKAELAVLSACNTAVIYPPKVKAPMRTELENDEEVKKELINAGWSPGVDQISLTDTFMKRNFKHVMGTLWFADDLSSSYIMSKFFGNLKNNDPVQALRQAQIDYLKNPDAALKKGHTFVPRHVFFWAVGAIFGI